MDLIEKIADLARESIKYKKITTESFCKLSINDALKLIENARVTLGKQDQFLQLELYHLLGMYDLNDQQMLAIAKLSRIIGKSRPWVKAIAMIDIKLLTIPKHTEYKCKFLGIKLKSNLEN